MRLLTTAPLLLRLNVLPAFFNGVAQTRLTYS